MGQITSSEQYFGVDSQQLLITLIRHNSTQLHDKIDKLTDPPDVDLSLLVRIELSKYYTLQKS